MYHNQKQRENPNMKTFVISIENGYSGCGIKEDFEVDENDLKDVPRDEWEDYVWDHLGGKEFAYWHFRKIGRSR